MRSLPPRSKDHLGMSTWHGENWQLIEPEQSASGAEIGVLWGRGVLDERIEHAGALALALTALARELGRTGVRVEVQLGSDTAGLRLQGAPEELRTAWARLPELFSAPLITPDLDPAPFPSLPWVQDVLLRTGGSAAALLDHLREAENADEPARRLLTVLDPRLGHVPSVFWTDQESLVGECFDVGLRPAAARGRRWADGTARWHRGMESQELGAHRAAAVPVQWRDRQLLSMMVPRGADGLMAAELVRRCLAEALTAAGGEGARTESAATGMGDGLHVVLDAHPRVAEDERPALLTDVLRRLDALSAESSAAKEANPAGVREALRGAARSLHVAVDPSLLDLREHPELSRLPVIAPAEEDPSAPVETFLPTRRAFMAGSAEPGAQVRLTCRTLRVEGMSGNGARYDYVPFDDVEIVELTRLLAWGRGPSGRLLLLDHAGRWLTVNPGALRGRKEFVQALAPSLQGVPRMRVRHPARRRYVDLNQVIGCLIPIGILALPAALFGGMAYHQQTAPAWSVQQVSWAGTAELTNGTEITAREPVRQPVPDGGIGEIAVAVNVCGGGQSFGSAPDGRAVEGETQNIVRRDDYALRDEKGIELTPIPSAEPAAVVLENGDCTTLPLRFRGEPGDRPVLVHTTAAGDEITWS